MHNQCSVRGFITVFEYKLQTLFKNGFWQKFDLDIHRYQISHLVHITRLEESDKNCMDTSFCMVLVTLLMSDFLYTSEINLPFDKQAVQK